MKWISVGDRLPEEGIEVLVVYSGDGYRDIFMGRREEDTWSIGGYFIRDENVTHWMPLPDKPE